MKINKFVYRDKANINLKETNQYDQRIFLIKMPFDYFDRSILSYLGYAQQGSVKASFLQHKYSAVSIKFPLHC